MSRSEYLSTAYQIRNNKIVVFDVWNGPKAERNAYRWTESKTIEEKAKKAEKMRKTRELAYSGKLSKGAKKRLEKAITLLVQCTPKRRIWNPVIKCTHYHKLSFVTLTVSDSTTNHTAKEAYQTLLRPMMQYLTKYKGVKNYVWKAELQKRGQIHYHLIFPNFVHYQYLQNKWNYLQLKAGYLKGYYKKYGEKNPNSVDIHSMKNVKDAAAYLTKYLTKEVQKEPKKNLKEEPGKDAKKTNSTEGKGKTVGKVWDCSLNLKRAKYYCEDESTTLQQNIKNAEGNGFAYHKTYERFTIIFCIRIKPTELLPVSGMFRYKKYMNDIATAA